MRYSHRLILLAAVAGSSCTTDGASSASTALPGPPVNTTATTSEPEPESAWLTLTECVFAHVFEEEPTTSVDVDEMIVDLLQREDGCSHAASVAEAEGLSDLTRQNRERAEAARSLAECLNIEPTACRVALLDYMLALEGEASVQSPESGRP